jgi:hypothetical protein
MKLLLILLFLAIFALHLQAQQMISVIDHDSRKPVWRAYFILNGDTIAYTSLQGIAVLPKVSGSIQLTCKNYKPIELNADSIPSVIRMKCLIERLKEVVVVGDSTKIKNKKKFDLPDNVLLEYELNDIYNNQGLKLPITSLYKLIGYKPKSQRRRNRTKKILEAYDESKKKDKKKVK